MTTLQAYADAPTPKAGRGYWVLQVSNNGMTVGVPGTGGARERKRGECNGWTAGAVRRHTRWLYSVDANRLDGIGTAVTLTIRVTPETADDWSRLVKNLHQRLRDAGMLRWTDVVEWQERGTPHLHLAVYAPDDWSLPPKFRQSGWPIMYVSPASLGAWIVALWGEVAGEYGVAAGAQHHDAIDGVVGWLAYLSKHAARGVSHYQRHGKPAGWEKTGRLWHKCGEWPTDEPERLALTYAQAHRYRRLVRGYLIAQRRAQALEFTRRGDVDKAAAAWRSVVYLRRRFIRREEHRSGFGGLSDWVPPEVATALALAAGWEGVIT